MTMPAEVIFHGAARITLRAQERRDVHWLTICVKDASGITIGDITLFGTRPISIGVPDSADLWSASEEDEKGAS